MTYRHATDRPDGTDLASGHVLVSAPGRTGFPVRLTDEIVLRAAVHLQVRGLAGPWSVLDPCCGAGHLLTIVGLRHRVAVRALTATDIDPEAVALAARNLALLAPGGLSGREADLRARAERSDRPAHAAAARSAARLRADLDALGDRSPLTIATAVADATRPGGLAGIVADGSVDLIVADVPYGNWSAWRTEAAGGRTGDGAPLDRLLDTVRPTLATGAVVAIASDKGQRPAHPAYRRLERWQVGRRRIELLEAVPTHAAGADGTA